MTNYTNLQFFQQQVQSTDVMLAKVKCAHDARHFELALAMKSGRDMMHPSYVLTPREIQARTRQCQMPQERMTYKVQGMELCLQETTLDPQPIGTYDRTFEDLFGWFEYVGLPYVGQATVLRMVKADKPGFFYGYRYVQYESGVFMLYDIEYYDVLPMSEDAKSFLDGALSVSAGKGFIDFEKNGKVVRFTDYRVTKMGVLVTSIAVAHGQDPIQVLVEEQSLTVQNKPHPDSILLRNFEMMPEKIIMIDYEGVQAWSDPIPYCAGLVLWNGNKVELTEMFYFVETAVFVVGRGMQMGENVVTWNLFREIVEKYVKRGYLLYVKGVAFEWKCLTGTTEQKGLMVQSKVSEHVYTSHSSNSQWQFVFHDLQMDRFEMLFQHYKHDLRIHGKHQHKEDYARLGLKAGGHLPTTECLFFLHHWYRTQQYLLVILRTLDWRRVYRQELYAHIVVERYRSVCLALRDYGDVDYRTGRLSSPVYWFPLIECVPPPPSLGPLCYYGPCVALAGHRIARSMSFLFDEAAERHSTNEGQRLEDEAFKVKYSAYWQYRNPFNVLQVNLAKDPQELVSHLFKYEWRSPNFGGQVGPHQFSWFGSFALQMDLLQKVARDTSKLISMERLLPSYPESGAELYALSAMYGQDFVRKMNMPIEVDKARIKGKDLNPSTSDTFQAAHDFKGCTLCNIDKKLVVATPKAGQYVELAWKLKDWLS